MQPAARRVPIAAGPFRNDETGENVIPERRRRPARVYDFERNYREITEYFERRLERLKIVKTTSTPRGQLLDWVPIESQHPKGQIASPPPGPVPMAEQHQDGERNEEWGRAELEHPGVERGPEGTVPILR